MKIISYACLLIGMLGYGLIRGNTPNAIVHESMLFFSLGIFLVLGMDDDVVRSMIRYAILVFWVSLIMCLLTYNIDLPILKGDSFTSEFAATLDNIGRHPNSVAYMIFRPFVQSGLILYIHGLWEKDGRLRFLQMLALPGYILINVVLFKFRGALVFFGIVAIGSIFVLEGIGKKLKFLSLLVIIAVFFLGWVSTTGGELFSKRVKGFDKTDKVIAYRLPEAERYFQVMGNEWLWGRGLGGDFKYSNSQWGRNRGGVHIGWISLTLKGGVPFLMIMLTFFGGRLRRKRGQYEKDPYYKVAWFLAPVIFLDWLVNPIAMNISFIFVYGLSFLFLGRLGKRAATT